MNNELFATLFEKLLPCPPSHIAIAVSGGGDSMALLALMQSWANKRSIDLPPLIVNHGMRTEALEEALRVQRWIKAMGLASEILHWAPTPPLHSGLMEKARHARYALLALACHRKGISHLCVAHHLDDVLETIWMRERQHSQWRGLAGMSALTFHYGVCIVRPLLTTSHMEVQSYLTEKYLPYVQDPSNNNPLFLRTHARQAIKELSAQERLSLIARTRSYAQQRQEEAQAACEGHHINSETTFLTLHECPRLKQYRLDQGCLLLSAWMASFSPRSLKQTQIENLWKRLVCEMSGRHNSSPKILMTGGGCLFIYHKETLSIFREGARIKDTSWPGKKEWVWDHRFFCYGVNTIKKKPLLSGSWKERYSGSGLPTDWPHPSIVFK